MTAPPPHDYLTPSAVLALPAIEHVVQLWHADGLAELPDTAIAVRGRCVSSA